MKHSKKNNTGLTFGLLSALAARMLVEGREKRAEAIFELIGTHFRAGTEMHRELRLSEALTNETVSSDVVALHALSQAQAECRKFDRNKLTEEKRRLSHSMKKMLGDRDYDMLYEQQVDPDEYRALASAQQLINAWSGNATLDISESLRLEETIVGRLTLKKQSVDAPLLEDSHGQLPPRMVIKMMIDKVNEIHGKTLTPAQVALVRDYARSRVNDSPSLGKKMSDVANTTCSLIEATLRDNDSTVTDVVKHALREALAGVEKDKNLAAVDDERLMRTLAYMKLSEELTNESR